MKFLLVKAGGKLPLVVKANDEGDASDQDEETDGNDDRDILNRFNNNFFILNRFNNNLESFL